jgi:hypothetical protein
LPKITALPFRKTGGNFSRFKKNRDWEPISFDKAFNC